MRGEVGADAGELRLISDLVGEGESRVLARVVSVFRDDDQVVLRLEDGTVSSVVSAVYRGHETLEQTGDKHWVDVWCDTDLTPLTTGDCVMIDQVTCVSEEETGVFRFIVKSGVNIVKVSNTYF